VTLTITVGETVAQPVVIFKIDNQQVKNSVSYTGSNSDKTWKAVYTAHADDKDGKVVAFSVTVKDKAGNARTQTSVTDGTSVTADKSKPTVGVSIGSNSNVKSTLANTNQQDSSTKIKPPKGWDSKSNAATTGNKVTLTITANEFIYKPTVVIKVGGQQVKNTVTVKDTKEGESQANANKIWTAEYTAHKDDKD
jgi:hypothetical protein